VSPPSNSVPHQKPSSAERGGGRFLVEPKKTKKEKIGPPNTRYRRRTKGPREKRKDTSSPSPKRKGNSTNRRALHVHVEKRFFTEEKKAPGGCLSSIEKKTKKKRRWSNGGCGLFQKEKEKTATFKNRARPRLFRTLLQPGRGKKKGGNHISIKLTKK